MREVSTFSRMCHGCRPNRGPGTYTENLTISISLKVIGSSAKTTIIDGGGNGTVVTIDRTGAAVTLPYRGAVRRADRF
jgi:hypothetical protein